MRGRYVALIVSLSSWAGPALSQTTVPPLPVEGLKADMRALSSDIRELVPTVRPMNPAVAGLAENVKDIADKSDGAILMSETDESIVLTVGSDVLFDFDSATLTPQARAGLEAVSRLLKQDSVRRVRVVGHTDSKGSSDYNQRLSEDRAAAVARFLTDDGVPKDRLKSEGRGETEPVAANEVDGRDNEQGRARNRRVEFILPRN